MAHVIIESALEAIDAHSGRAEDFTLAVADSLADPLGIAIAIITDRILQRGWMPNGFEQGAGFRVYHYSSD